MSDQLPLDLYRREASDRARREGERRAGAALSETDREWRRRADAALDRWADSGAEFTSEEIRDEVGAGPSPGSLGVVFGTASRDRRIVAVGFDRTRHHGAHSRLIVVWRGAHERPPMR